MDARARALRNEQALELHLAGASPARIAAAIACTVPTAKRAVEAAFAARLADVDPEADQTVRDELARIDAMLVGLWPAARRGDTKSVEAVVRLHERRDRLRHPRPNDRALRAAFDAAMAASKHVALPLDGGLVEAGRKIADRVDEATATGEGQEVTKALYLIPHMMNILAAALATPASRAAAKAAAGGAEQAGGRLAGMRRGAPTANPAGLRVVGRGDGD